MPNYRKTKRQQSKLPKNRVPNYRKISFQVTEYELVNEIFEPFEQVNQVQTLLLVATFEMLSGGPTQTHVGTGGGGSSSDKPRGEKKNACNTSRRRI